MKSNIPMGREKDKEVDRNGKRVKGWDKVNNGTEIRKGIRNEKWIRIDTRTESRNRIRKVKKGEENCRGSKSSLQMSEPNSNIMRDSTT